MNSLERTLAVLDHRIPDRVPVALHNFLMACRMVRADFRDTLRSGELLAEAQLAAWREFGHDVIMHENGVCAEAEALGCEILYPAEGAPHVADPVVKSLDDVARLNVPDPEKTFPLNELLKATRILVRETRGEVFIIGRADQGPMALAAALCGPEKLLTAAADPALRSKVLQLLDLCSRMNRVFGEAQRRAGAHGSSIGAYGSSLISPRMYDELEFPGNKAFVEAMRQVGCRSFVHSCGNETALLPHLVRTGADCLELDPLTDPKTCKDATRGKTSVLGMLDPHGVLRRGDPSEVREHTLDIMRIMAPGGGFLMGPGCALPLDAPAASIHTVMDCARTAGAYRPDGSLSGFPPRPW
ncbi:MAG: uroporphyrinogen decarboxylase family protein [Acidobacteriia bacterium]|nr:uroporphyrinogen decarboxylase family protein [Terriglobia bacterium]